MKSNHDTEINGRMKSQQNGDQLQEPFLNALRKQKIPVSIYLTNGIKLQGQIESFDRFALQLKAGVTQMIYKHAIMTIVPSKSVTVDYEQ